MPLKTIIDPLGFPLIQYKLECADKVNDILIEQAYIMNKFVDENHKNIFGMNPKGTKYNNDKDSYIGAHTPPFNRCHMFPGFPVEFLEELLHCVYDFAKHCGVELRQPSSCMFYVERGWSTITKPGDIIDGHTHITHTFSSAYYPNWKEGQGGIWFQRRKHDDDHSMYEKFKGANEQVAFQPVAGSVFLFPSWIPHGTLKNESDEDRISYSFDIGEVGLDYKLPPTSLIENMWKEFDNDLTNIGLMEVLK